MAPIQSPISVCIRPTHRHMQTHTLAREKRERHTRTQKRVVIFSILSCTFLLVGCFFFPQYFVCVLARSLWLSCPFQSSFNLSFIDFFFSHVCEWLAHVRMCVSAPLFLCLVLCVYAHAFVCLYFCLVHSFASHNHLSHSVFFALFYSIFGHVSVCVLLYILYDMNLVSAKIARETKTQSSK